MTEKKSADNQNKQLVLQKIYIKDFSFESPRAPEIFKADMSPQTELNIRSSSKEVGENAQEVSLTLTVEAKENDKALFLVELEQAGVFIMQGYTEEERQMLVGSYCPNALSPLLGRLFLMWSHVVVFHNYCCSPLILMLFTLKRCKNSRKKMAIKAQPLPRLLIR